MSMEPIRTLDPIKETTVQHFLSKSYSASDVKGRVITIFSNEGVGKSVLAAKLGDSNIFLTDDNGILSLQNHPELDACSVAIPFEGYEYAKLLLRACENGQIIHPKTDMPVDNVIFDTISGMCSTEIRRSIENHDIQTENGKLADNIPTRPHYLLNEQNFGPLMKTVGQMRNCSVTLLSHLRTGTTDVPGASTRPDLHGASYKLMAKYSSVVGYMYVSDDGGNTSRFIRVMPGEMVAAKTRYNFGKRILTDEEFVAEIHNWKNKENS